MPDMSTGWRFGCRKPPIAIGGNIELACKPDAATMTQTKPHLARGLAAALAALALAGCQSSGVGALDLQGYPNVNVVPQAAAPALTPEDEYRMLLELNAVLAKQPQLNPQQNAEYLARQRRLAELARIHGFATEQAIIGN
jgi:hypothetical protein